MDRKRGIQSRPAASEETNVWNQARSQLIAFSKMYSSPATTETIGRVNRLISVWPSDDTVPAEGLEDIQHTHNKLRAGLRDIDTTSNNEVKAIEQALEKIGVLIALRQAPEPVIDKRNKRPRAPSPSSSTSHGTQSATASRGVSITLPPRNAAGTPLGTASARSGSRKDYMGRQLPLRPGRNIAFFPPPKRDQDEESSDWILAVITRCINSEKNKYEVRDVDEENPETYTTTLKFMIPLPDPGAAPGSPESLSSYPEHAKGSTVLALYPDTSCFYRAVVVNPPDHQKAEMDKTTPAYVLRFEDDGEQTQVCMAYYVVEAPKE